MEKIKDSDVFFKKKRNKKNSYELVQTKGLITFLWIFPITNKQQVYSEKTQRSYICKDFSGNHQIFTFTLFPERYSTSNGKMRYENGV